MGNSGTKRPPRSKECAPEEKEPLKTIVNERNEAEDSSPQRDKTTALTFGSVEIPMRFVGRPSSSAKEKYMSKYLKFDVNEATTDLTVSLWNLMIDTWKIEVPSVVFSVTGGKIPDKDFEAMQTIATAMKKITSQTESWIISDGRNYGTSKYLGKMLQPEDSRDSKRQKHSPVFVSATHWGSLHSKELLLRLPSEFKSSQYFYSMEYKLSHEEDIRDLNPYQAVYLLLDDGRSAAGDCPLKFRSEFEQFIKKKTEKQMCGLQEVTIPIVTLVIGGDKHTFDQVLDSVKSKNPVIVVNNSGEIPSLLSEIFYALEATHPRRWDENAAWTDGETTTLTTTFNTYMERNEENLSRIWNCSPEGNAQKTVLMQEADRKDIDLEDIKKTIREIMKKRYYVTVVESSFENEESLHCSILQGIYKGYSNGNGMAIALETGTYDFIQALFLREVDPQFTKGPYITVHALNYFHQKNLCSKDSISKVLKFMCKRGSTIAKVDPDESILPVVGRILHLLLGPRYKVMYQEDKYSGVTEDMNFKDMEQRWHLFFWPLLVAKPAVTQFFLVQNFKDMEEQLWQFFLIQNFKDMEEQLWHLFLLSVLVAKPDMTQFFLMQTSAPLGASLLAFKLYSQLAFYSRKIYEEELAVTLSSAADHFQVIAIEILDNMYNTDADEAYRVLISELPFGLGPYVTPLVIADDSDAKDFMSHSCCQAYLQKVWKGNMAVGTPAWKSLPVLPLFLFILPIRFDGSPLKPRDVESEKAKPKTHIFSKVKSYYTAPINKFHTRMFAYMAFLGLLSYYVLTDLKPFTSFTEITVSEWIVIVWELMLIVEEIVQFATIFDVGPLAGVKLNNNNNNIWHWYEKLRMHLYLIELYFRSGRWNSVDLSMVMLFIVSFALRFSLPLETFQMARVFFAVTVIVCYFRLLRFWSVLGKLGQRIIAIEMMLTELVKFIIILALFVVSFGVAFQAILNPNQTPSWTTFGDILYRPYWEMFGELFLMEDPGMGRPVSNFSCYSEEYMYVNGTHIMCYKWAVPVLLGIYLLISSVLLLNLLVAIFSMAYEEVNAMSRKISRFNHYSLTHESFYNEWLPPPLSILAHLYLFISLLNIVKRCKSQKRHEEEGCFWFNPLPSSHELQKQASKGVKMYAKDDRDVNIPSEMKEKETSKLDRDDMIEALTDGRVIEALTTRLMVSLTPARDDSILKSENELLKQQIKQLKICSRADNPTSHGVPEVAAAQGTSGQETDNREPVKK